MHVANPANSAGKACPATYASRSESMGHEALDHAALDHAALDHAALDHAATDTGYRVVRQD
jgi:hypothetical protein